MAMITDDKKEWSKTGKADRICVAYFNFTNKLSKKCTVK